ncbi:MAG: hypothetical protein R3F05_08075 [Planctomycetota bacterium]
MALTETLSTRAAAPTFKISLGRITVTAADGDTGDVAGGRWRSGLKVFGARSWPTTSSRCSSPRRSRSSRA